jgi:hypothetical protein
MTSALSGILRTLGDRIQDYDWGTAGKKVVASFQRARRKAIPIKSREREEVIGAYLSAEDFSRKIITRLAYLSPRLDPNHPRWRRKPREYAYRWCSVVGIADDSKILLLQGDHRRSGDLIRHRMGRRRRYLVSKQEFLRLLEQSAPGAVFLSLLL